MEEPIDLAARRRQKEAAGAVATGTFVCTACSSGFRIRALLEDHWTHHPACRAALSRPVGTFGSDLDGKHCLGCHDPRGHCVVHANCPGCAENT